MVEHLHDENKVLKSLDDKITKVIQEHINNHRITRVEIVGVLETVKLNVQLR